MFNYLLFPLLIIFSASLGMIFTPAWNIAPFILILIVIPLMDAIFPKLVATGNETKNPAMYEIMLFSIFPILIILIGSALRFVSESESIIFIASLGAAIGMATGSVGLPAAHELIHRRNQTTQTTGLLILLICFYAHFRIEHIHGHHSKVATADDPATARFGESLYSFLVRCISSSWISAWKIENNRLRNRQRLLINFSNRMILYTTFQVVYLITIFLVFDTRGLIFILAHTVIAIFYVN